MFLGIRKNQTDNNQINLSAYENPVMARYEISTVTNAHANMETANNQQTMNTENGSNKESENESTIIKNEGVKNKYAQYCR